MYLVSSLIVPDTNTWPVIKALQMYTLNKHIDIITT